MHHLRKTYKMYKQRQKSGECPFCEQATLDNSVRETKLSYVVPNLTYYDFWELSPVQEHLLGTPRRHVHSLSELSAKERLDIMNICAEYEAKGYHVYARGTNSAARSVSHQHTHLIKVIEKPARLVLYLRKPYLLLNL